MYAPPFIVTPALLRALQLADDVAAASAPSSSPRASFADLPDELVVRVGTFTVSRHPRPTPRYASDGVYYFQPTWQPLRLVDRRSARVLPAPASSTFTLPQGQCVIT